MRFIRATSQTLFGTEQNARRIQAERKQYLYKQRESLLAQRAHLINEEQASAVKDAEVKAKKVADIEQALNKSKEAYSFLLHQQFHATQVLNSTHGDLQELSDTSLDLVCIS